jgi:transcription factor IIIB subunit 2
VSHWPEKDIVEPSIFIARFVALLEFGDDSHKVASDAVRIAARFKQDWIHEGRRTAGICGAAIYLAAQMNNYRRSIQEITQVAKIADVTILKRLEEFSVTPSAQLTVNDFKSTDAPTEAAMPPSWIRAREKEKDQAEGGRKRRARKRKRGQEDPEEGNTVEGTAPTEDSLPVVRSLPAQDSRPLNRGVPIDPQLLGEGILKGAVELQEPQASGSVSPPTPLLNEPSTSTSDARPPALELEPDPETAQEIETLLHSERGRDAARIAQLAIVSRGSLQNSNLQLVAHTEVREDLAVGEGERDAGAISEPEDGLNDLDEAELDAFLCSPEEAAQRERIWTEFNLDYLRKLAGNNHGLFLVKVNTEFCFQLKDIRTRPEKT